MMRLDISLPDDLGDWAATRANEARLGGASEYVAGLLRRDRDEAQRLERLREAIEEGLASPVVETTIDEIIARAKVRHGLA